MEKVINMDSWHFKLYERGMGWSIGRWNSVHCVNRCRYLKKILRGILEIVFITVAVIIAIGAIPLTPFAVFHLFMTHLEGMVCLTTVLAGIGLSIPVIAVKRKMWRRVRKTKYISFGFGEVILGCFRDVGKELCPILTARHLKQ